MTEEINLTGISWDHPRGIDPLRATAPDYRAIAPRVEVQWAARSLLGFGEDPLEVLATRFDLLVIDHPFVGLAARSGVLHALDALVPEADLDHLAAESVGQCFASYVWDEHVWALPIDAAAQVSAWRPDLLVNVTQRAPTSWSQVFGLAGDLRAKNLWAAMPMIHTDLVPAFFSIAATLGEPAFQAPDRWILSPQHLDRVLDTLLRLRDVLDPRSLHLNPPALFDLMASGDEIAYCPLAFGYANYARAGFRANRLRFGDVPSRDRRAHGSTLGGAGIAVSSATAHPLEAARYALWLATGAVQKGPYFDGGGQPAHRQAWLDGRLNTLTDQFFVGTLATLDGAFLRPRWPGYLTFQDAAGPALRDFVGDGVGRVELVERLEAARIAALDERNQRF